MAISTSLVLKFDGAAVQRGLASIKKSFSKLGDALQKIGIGIGAFAVAAAAGLVAAAIKINAIGESAAAGDKRLQNITKQMGLFGDKSDDVSKRLLEFADAQERLTGVDTVVATQAKLMTFAELAKTADQVGGAFDRATMAAIDMAAAGFGSAEGNAVQLGKALNDPVKGIKALTKSGITFTEKQQQMITAMVETGKMGQAQNEILKAIETQVKGTAEATSTASGRITQSFNQIVEAFAIPFSESFNGLPGMLEGVFPSLIAKAEEAGGFVSAAISEAIASDTTKLEAIGVLIAEVIGAAMVSTFEIAAAKMMEGVSKLLFGEIGGGLMENVSKLPSGKIGKSMWNSITGGLLTDFTKEDRSEFNDFISQMTRNKVSGSIKSGTFEAMERYRQTIATQSPLGREREQQAQVSAMQQAGRTFAAAGMPQAQRTPGTSPDILSAISSIPDMVRQTIVELKNVNRSLAPTP